MDTHRPGRARTRTGAHAGHTPRAGPKPYQPGGSRTLDSGSGASVREEGGRRRLPRGAAGAGAALTRLCRLSVSQARCAPVPAADARVASAASGPAGGRTRGLGAAVPRASSALPPRAPPRACALVDSGLGTGRGGASGEVGPREGGTPSPWPQDSCVARPPGPGSRFTDEETEGWRGCAPVEGEAHCLRSHSIQAREHPLLVSQRRKLGFREEKPLVRGHSAPGWVPSSASSPSSRCTEISRLLLGRTSGLPPTPCSNPLSRSRPRPCECRDKSDGRVCVWEAPPIPPPPATLAS